MQGKEIPEKRWKEFLEILQESFGSVALVCQQMNIARRSYYNKRLRDPVFANNVDLIFERIQVPIAEEMLRNNVLKDNWQAIRYTLDRSSRKWHPKLSEGYIWECEELLTRIEIGIREKLDPKFKVEVVDKTAEMIEQIEKKKEEEERIIRELAGRPAF